MVSCLSWGRCLSSRLWLFRSPGTGGSWRRSGLTWTTVEQGGSSTERARSPPSWGGPRAMSRCTSQSSPTSTPRGPSSPHGTKLLSSEATPSHRYKLTFNFAALQHVVTVYCSSDPLWRFQVSRSVIPKQRYLNLRWYFCSCQTTCGNSMEYSQQFLISRKKSIYWCLGVK